MIIGVTGPIASGKSVLVDKLISAGFINLRLSAPLKEIATERGIPHERGPLQDLGNELRALYGAGYLAEQLLKKVESNKDYVIDSIRNPGEVMALQKYDGFTLVGFDAPYDARIQFLLNRKKHGDPTTIEEVIAMEARDRGSGEGANGQQVEECLKMANVKIYNDGTLRELITKVDNFMSGLKI